MNYLALLAKIVAIADEIRKNIAAQGEEAKKQFEQAVERNRKSFADMVVDLGGAPAEPEKPTPEPEDERYNRWRDDPGDGMLEAGDHVYGREHDNLVWVVKGGPIRLGFPGAPKKENLLRVVG